MEPPEALMASTVLEVGQVLGEFRLRRVLGQGPLGEVYAAERSGDGARVVVRVLADAIMARPDLRRRIGRDLATLQGIEHPAVARLLEIGEQHGHLFYGLADPADLSLQDLVRRGRPLGELELVWLAAGLSAGVAALHAAGLPHGSVAPNTIFVTPRGPVIVDLAWTCRLRDTSTAADPGEAPAPSVAHDLRALGLSLVLAATGKLPTDPGARAFPQGTSARITALVDQLLGPVDKRPPAEKVARLFGQMAKTAGVDVDPPASIVALIEQATRRTGPGPDATLVQGAPGDGAVGEAPALGTFGRYVLLEEIGRGGMGVVYKARHADFERYFALKVMLSGALADDTARKRFLHEAEAAAALDHPTIVRVHDCGVVDGRAYIAMDLTEGRPLSEVFRDPAWTLDALLRLFVEALRGVHYAHSRGIIHRDLKPANVIVDPEGRPHLLDFGVAKRVGDTSGVLTVQGELVGTPAYMPPEQAEGRGNDIDTRSDVYAMGASLFEVVTRGRWPFEGTTVTDVLTRILLEDPAVPSALRPELPWEVDAIVLKALEKPRERRYQSAAEMAEDLQRFLRGLPILARQASWSYKAKKWLARRWVLVVGVVALLSVGAGTAAVFVARQRAAAAQVADDVAGKVAEGDQLLAKGEPRLAVERYAQALALDDANLGASLGRERALARIEEDERQARAERERAQRERERAQAVGFVDAARQREAEGDLKAARAAYEQAMAFEDAPDAAREGLMRVERALGAREAEERAAALASHDSGRAADHEAAAEAHQAAGRLREAQAAFLQATAFGSTTAADKLAHVEEALLAERMAQVQEEVRARNAAETRRLLGEGFAALDKNEAEAARRAFLQALGFDGASQEAQQGLIEADRLQRAQEQRLERAARLARADEQVKAARAAHERGRTLFREGSEDVDAVREAYILALEAYDRALFEAPDHAVARGEKAYVAREASTILREEGRYELADFLLRIGGVTDGAPAEAPPLPSDPHLVVVEADKVNIRRAFGGVVRFQSTRVFDALRAHVRERSGGRFRVVLQVRSEATVSLPPLVHAKGVWVRVEDKVASTLSRTERVDFEGGPFVRQVTVDAQGRIVSAWERARDLPAQRYIDAIEAAAKRLLAEAETARPGG